MKYFGATTLAQVLLLNFVAINVIRLYLNKNGKKYEDSIKGWSECYVNKHVFTHMGLTALVEGCGEVPGPDRPPWKLVLVEHSLRFLWGLLLLAAHAPFVVSVWTGARKVAPAEKF